MLYLMSFVQEAYKASGRSITLIIFYTIASIIEPEMFISGDTYKPNFKLSFLSGAVLGPSKNFVRKYVPGKEAG